MHRGFKRGHEITHIHKHAFLHIPHESPLPSPIHTSPHLSSLYPHHQHSPVFIHSSVICIFIRDCDSQLPCFRNTSATLSSLFSTFHTLLLHLLPSTQTHIYPLSVHTIHVLLPSSVHLLSPFSSGAVTQLALAYLSFGVVLHRHQDVFAGQTEQL